MRGGKAICTCSQFMRQTGPPVRRPIPPTCPNIAPDIALDIALDIAVNVARDIARPRLRAVRRDRRVSNKSLSFSIL